MKQSNWMTYTRRNGLSGSTHLSELNDNNIRIVLEYQTATPWRRAEIFEEYYKNNVKWITRWPRWDYQHWDELTQIYVSYWHEYFMRYKKTSEKSVFNFYMENCCRSRASKDYISWLEKGRRLFNPENLPQEQKLKESFVNPQSEYDKAVLRTRLNRCLDSKDMDALKEHVYGDRELNEIMGDELKALGELVTPKACYARTNHFKRYRLRDLRDRLSMFTSPEELYDLISAQDIEHPLAVLKQHSLSRLVHHSNRKSVEV
jgi:hypothetical protein